MNNGDSVLALIGAIILIGVAGWLILTLCVKVVNFFKHLKEKRLQTEKDVWRHTHTPVDLPNYPIDDDAAHHSYDD